MPLLTTLRPEWPRLAWLASCRAGDAAIRVEHGPGVDTAAEFVCEAVWDGPFREGGFDLTDNVFGSGVRRRGDRAFFVASCGSNDRIVSAQIGDEAWVSNSLPCVMRAIGAEPDPAERHYPEMLEGTAHGLGRYPAYLPTTRAPLRLTYHHNLVWDGWTLAESPKPWPDRPLVDFESYFGFMNETLAAFAKNMADPARLTRHSFLGTMSSGYDSTTCVALALPHGLREAISFTCARNGDNDSGVAAAAALGVDVTTYGRDDYRKSPGVEISFIAADAKGEDVYFGAAIPMLRNRVLVTGHHGDMMWGKDTPVLADRIQRLGGTSGLSMTEFRLHVGFIHATLPFIAVRDIAKLNAISNQEAMRPWDVGGKYNRPICRRIVEGMGVPREAFGQSKKAGSVLFGYGLNDLSDSAHADFERWRRENEPRGTHDAVIETLARVRGLAFRNATAARVISAIEGPYGSPRMLPIVGGPINDARRYSLGLTQRNSLYRWATAHAVRSYPSVREVVPTPQRTAAA